MPAPAIPPFAPAALTYPRELQRWLDLNYQGGALTRVSTWITLPAFINSNETWNGYSDIVQSFNIESPNNFSLKAFPAPTTSNFVLCVSYRVQGVVARYMLWGATGSNLPVVAPAYTGQMILKNCRFEIWNTSQGTASLSSAINFYTSVTSAIDYRYGSDSSLVAADAPCTSFSVSVITQVPNSPFTGFDIVSPAYWFDPSTLTVNETNGTWIDTVAALNFVTTQTNTEYLGYPYGVEFSSGGRFTATEANLFPGAVLLTIKPGGVATYFTNGNGFTLGFNGANKLTAFGTGVSNIAINPMSSNFYIVYMVASTATVYVYSFGTMILLDTFTGAVPAGNSSNYVFSVATGSSWDVMIWANGTTCNNLSTVIQYLNTRWFANSQVFSLPITFPSGSVSVTN